MKIQVVTYKTTEYGREIERNDTGQSLLATLKAAGIDGITEAWDGGERNGVQISTLSPDDYIHRLPFKGIQFRAGKHMRRVMVKNGEIDEVALRSKLAELKDIASLMKGQANRKDEERRAKEGREAALASEAGISLDRLVEVNDGTYRLDLRGLTRDQVLAIGRGLEKGGAMTTEMETRTCPVKTRTPSIGNEVQESVRCDKPVLPNGYCQDHQRFARLGKKEE